MPVFGCDSGYEYLHVSVVFKELDVSCASCEVFVAGRGVSFKFEGGVALAGVCYYYRVVSCYVCHFAVYARRSHFCREVIFRERGRYHCRGYDVKRGRFVGDYINCLERSVFREECRVVRYRVSVRAKSEQCENDYPLHAFFHSFGTI